MLRVGNGELFLLLQKFSLTGGSIIGLLYIYNRQVDVIGNWLCYADVASNYLEK